MVAKTKTNQPKTASLTQGYGALSSRQLPSYLNPTIIEKALKNAHTGDFKELGGIIENLKRDDRIRGALDSRINGLIRLPLSTLPAANVGDKDDYTAQLIEDLPTILPDPVKKELIENALLAGFSIAQLIWEPKSRLDNQQRVLCFARVFHTTNIVEKDNQYYVVDSADKQYLVDESKPGEWFIYRPFGDNRAFSKGLWTSLAYMFLMKEYARLDWSRYSEKHGQGILVATVAQEAIQEFGAEQINIARNQIVNFFQNLGREKGVALPPGFDVKLVEASSNSYEVFSAQIEACDKAISIAILGQNLTTDVSTGSYAASKVHASVKADIIAADNQSLTDAIRTQIICPWAEYNFGNPNSAPWINYDTSEPEDLAAVVSTWKSTADAIKSWTDQGVPVDIISAAKKVGIPLIDGQQLQLDKATPIYQYHYQYVPMTINKARSFINLAPIAGGEKRLEPISSASTAQENSIQEFEQESQPISSTQKDVDLLIDQAISQAQPFVKDQIESLMSIINSQDPNDPKWREKLANALIDSFNPATNEELALLSERAIILANLMGYMSINEEI